MAPVYAAGMCRARQYRAGAAGRSHPGSRLSATQEVAGDRTLLTLAGQ
ncbi:MAG: hypothetical protein JO337_12690 [Acidimicrobiales bacterium]|nr:hypothetical protein [Acidimicrobiales bacterium]